MGGDSQQKSCTIRMPKVLGQAVDIFNLACPISMRFCHFECYQNHLAWYSERASDIGFFVIFIVYVWCVFLLLGTIGSLCFVAAVREYLF